VEQKAAVMICLLVTIRNNLGQFDAGIPDFFTFFSRYAPESAKSGSLVEKPVLPSCAARKVTPG
jgi:hypothetical protein